MNAFTIKELEILTGIKAHTIRIWEQRYHFLKPQRTATNIRYYSKEELKTILRVALLNKYGFKISHIDRMKDQEMKENILSLADAQALQDRTTNSLLEKMMDLDMEGFEKIINEQIKAKGIERAVIHVIFPFLEKTGILWQTGRINPVHEHLVSNIIRQKLIVGIETTVSQIKMDRTFLLFLPEGEHLELGLLFMYYLIKSRGARAIYLGANVPLKDVQHVIRVKKPDTIFIHLTASGTAFKLEKFLKGVQQDFDGVNTIISGLVTAQYKKKIPQFVQFKRTLTEVMEYFSSL